MDLQDEVHGIVRGAVAGLDEDTLTDGELLQRGQDLARSLEMIADLDEKKADFMRDHKERMGALQQGVRRLRWEIRTKTSWPND
jgi:hypothetical protein